MRGNLPEKEPQLLDFWQKNQVYQQMLARRKGAPNFTMPDGPPYANGDIHIGHALNKTLKDIVIKYKNLTGFEAHFIPGWDCHGLPIEHKVMKELGAEASKQTDQEIRALCRKEANHWVEHQKAQFKRLGVFAEWENPYLTMSAEYEAEEVRVFARLVENKLIYIENKPVYWNWFLQTALAEAEVEYHPHKSPSVYLKFPVTDSATLKKLGNPQGPTFFAVWTTTPWTLPANLGLSLHPDFTYGVFRVGAENWILARSLQEGLEQISGQKLEKISEFKGKDLERGIAQHPFLQQTSLIVLGEHVTADTGTGVVHTAPGHGADDYRVGHRYGLPIYAPVDPRGHFTPEVKDWAGMHIFKANPLIVEKLRSLGHLIHFSEFSHSYPHCWRSKTPLIFRATPQWFLGLDLEDSRIREKTLKAVQELKFFPQWGEARFRAMIELRPDWCVSRQRLWGVPIPSFVCKKTGLPLIDSKVMLRVADEMEKHGGIEAFYQFPPEHFIGKWPFQGDFGSEGFTHGKDILDVWFDSGVCFAAVQKRRSGMKTPADIYLEGSDQHRGWFNTSMLASMAQDGHPPYKALVTHGFVMDSQGLKMSKSKGNTVDPNQVAQKSGADILRLWSVYEDYGQDLTCGDAEIERVTETYRKIRNTMRYLLGSLNDFEFAKDRVEYSQMTDVDQWILHRLNELVVQVRAGFDQYSFYKVYHALNVFFTVDLSALYFDVMKDRTYTWRADGRHRRSSQTVFWHVLDVCVRLISPILSFLAEEVHQHRKDKTTTSVFLLDFPEPHPEWKNPQREDQFTRFFEIKSLVQKELEGLRTQKVIGSSLEAAVRLKTDSEGLEFLKSFENLRELFVVSKLDFENGLDKGGVQIHAQRAPGEKCVRCWILAEDISSAGICGKCREALQLNS